MDAKAIFLIILVLALTLPAIYKPLHVDDILFFEAAQHLQNHPLEPYSYKFNQVGLVHDGQENMDPLLIPYYYAAIMSLFGESVVLLHLFYMPFSILAGVAMYYISRRFVKNSLICTLFFISTPVFLVMSHNLMVDIPSIAFFLASLSLFIYGVDTNKHSILILSAILASLTPLIKYNGLLVIPLMGLYAILKKKYLYTLYLMVPSAIFGLWMLWTYLLYGIPHPLFSAVGIHDINKTIGGIYYFISVRFISNLIYTGSIAAFSLLFLPLIIKSHKAYKWLLGISVAISIILVVLLRYMSGSFFSGQYSYAEVFFMGIFLSAGFFYLFFFCYVFYTRIRKKFDTDLIFLFAWLMSIFMGSILFAGGAVRYFTMILPPFIIMLLFIIENHKLIDKSIFKAVSYSGLAVTFILAVSLAYADYQYTSVYRAFPEDVSKVLKLDGKVNYFGDYGFSYSMDKKGYSYLITEKIPEMLDQGNVSKKKQYIIKPQILFPRDINKGYFNNRLKLLTKVEFNTKFPIRVQNYQAHAGFYTFSAGLLPYTLSTKPLEVFYVYELQ